MKIKKDGKEIAEIEDEEIHYLKEEIKLNESAKEQHQRAIQMVDWLNPLLQKRIEERENELGI